MNIMIDADLNIILNPYTSARHPKKNVIRFTPMLKEEFIAPKILPLKDLAFPFRAIEDSSG